MKKTKNDMTIRSSATAFDYDKSSKTTIDFFKTVQNKIHFAVHRQTAAKFEIYVV